MQNIKFKKLEMLLLSIIVFFAAFLYTYKLSNNPPGLYLDEVGTVYNTYSILKTGKDEYGKFMPMAFKLFGSYTPPLYIYLSVPFVAAFGMSIFSARILSVVCGLLEILVVFSLLKELKITKNKITILISILFFVITPWMVMFSRMGYEQMLAFLFFSTSILLIAKSINNPKLVIFAIPFISISTYTDYPQRLVAPILFLAATIVFWKKLFVNNNLKQIVIGVIVAGVIQLPNLYFITTPSFYTKTEHFYSDVIKEQAKKIDHYLPHFISLPLSFTREFTSQYFTYLSPRSLFFQPDDDPQRSMPEISVFYSWMLIPYLIGLYYVFKNKSNLSIKLIIVALLVSPLPGALTKQPFHTQRTLDLLLPITLIMSLGIDKILEIKYKKLIAPVILFTFAISSLFLWRSYFVLLPKLRDTVWASPFKELTDYITSHPNETFVIDQSGRTKPQEMAYSQIAFYSKLDPVVLQNDQPINPKDYYTNTSFSFVHKFANVETKSIEWGETSWRKIILVGDIFAISETQAKEHNLTQVFEIKDSNDQVVLRGFKTNPKNSK